MNMVVKQRKSSHQTLSVQWTLNHRKTQREDIHQPTNQMPHLPHLKFKFDPLVIPNGVTILWTSHFAQCVPNRWQNSFFFLIYLVKIWFLEKIGSRHLFLFIFFKGKQHKKENSKCDSLFRKDSLRKTKPRFGGQVVYWEDTVKTVAFL